VRVDFVADLWTVNFELRCLVSSLTSSIVGDSSSSMAMSKVRAEDRFHDCPFIFRNGDRCLKSFSTTSNRMKHMLLLHLAVVDRDVPRGYRVYPLNEYSESLWRTARRHAQCAPDATWPPDWYYNPDEVVATADTGISANRSGRDNKPVKRLRVEEGQSTSVPRSKSSSSSIATERRAVTAQAVLSLPAIRRVSKKDKASGTAASTSSSRGAGIAVPTSTSSATTSVPPAAAELIAVPDSAVPDSLAVGPDPSMAGSAGSAHSETVSVVSLDSSDPIADTSMVTTAVNQTSGFVRVLSAPPTSSAVPASPSAPARGMTEFAWMAACLLQASQGRGPASEEVNERCGLMMADWIRSLPEAPCSSCPLQENPCGDCVDRNLCRMMIRAAPADPRLAGRRSTGGDLAVVMLHRIPELFPVSSSSPCRWCLVVPGPCRSCFGAFLRGPGSRVFRPPVESPIRVADDDDFNDVEPSSSSSSSSSASSREGSPMPSRPPSTLRGELETSMIDLGDLAQGTVFEIRALSPTDLINGQSQSSSLFGQTGNRLTSGSGSSTPVMDERDYPAQTSGS